MKAKAHTVSIFPSNQVEQFVGGLRRKPMLLGALLVFSTLLLYSAVRHYEFLDFDDSQYVIKNIHVSTGWKLGNVAWAFTTFYAANWHPVTWLSHMTDCQLFGLSSGSQHMVNVALHLTVSPEHHRHPQIDAASSLSAILVGTSEREEAPGGKGE
jgi:hypothetical protein